MDLVPEFGESHQSFLDKFRQHWKSILFVLLIALLLLSSAINISLYLNRDRACYPMGSGEECVSIRQTLRAFLQGSLPLECTNTLVDGTNCDPNNLRPLLPRLRNDIDTLKRLQSE